MANNIKGITVEIGGNTGPLDTALKGVNKTSRDLQGELRNVNQQLKLDPSNTVLLTQKQKLLAESVTATKGKLETLKIAESQAQEQFKKGKISEEQYRALQREVIKTEGQLKNLEVQAGKSNVTLSKISTGAKGIADGAGNIAGKMAPVTLGIVGLGTAATKMGSDYIESLNKVEVAFGKNAKEVEAWSETTLSKFGVAKGSALETASLFGDMGTAMGLTTGEAAKMSMSLGGLGADLSSFKNISLEQSQTALKGIFTGEGEALKTLGIVMQDSTLKEFAHANGIKKKYEEMSQAEKVNLRYNFVMEKTKNAQGDFANTADGAANSTRMASESAKEASASFGVILAPMLAKVAQYIANMAKNFAGLSESTKKTILIVLGIVAAIAPLAGLISGIATIVGVIIPVIATIAGTITLLTGGVVVATPAMLALKAAFTLITGPIGLTILAIAALVAGFAYLWTRCEGFRTFWINLWQSIKDITKITVDALVGFFTVTIPGAWTSLVSFFTGIPAWFGNLWASVKTITENIWNGIASFFSNIWNGIKAIFVNAINGLVTLIISSFSQQIIDIKVIFGSLGIIFENIWSIIKNIFLGALLLIIDLVTGNFTKLKEDAAAIFTNLKDLFINIWENIKNIFKYATRIIATTLTQAWTGMVTVATTIWNGFANFMARLWEGIKGTAISAWEGLKSVVIAIVGALVQGAISTFNGIINFFSNLPGTLYNLGVNMFNGLKNGITSVLSTLGSVISSGFNSAVKFIKDLPGQALTWGADMIKGFVDGVNNKIKDVVDSVVNVADKIRRVLHFTVPDEGPLSDADTYGGDFMQLLADSMDANSDKPAQAAKRVADVVSEKIKSIKETSIKEIKALNDELSKLSNEETIALRGVKGNQRYAIQDEYSAKKNAIKEQIDLRKEQADKEIAEIQRIGKASKEELKQEIQDKKDFVEKVNSLNDQIKNALKEKYTQEQKSQEDSLSKQEKGWEDWKDTSEKAINDLFDSKSKRLEEDAKATEIAFSVEKDSLDRWKETSINNIEEVSAVKTKALQAQIDLLDEQTKAESRAEADKKELANINKLQGAVGFEHNDYNKAELQKQLDQATAGRNKRLNELAVVDKKDSLKQQIDAVKIATDGEKENIQNMYIFKKADLDKRANDSKIYYQNQKTLMDQNKKAQLDNINQIYTFNKVALDNELADVKLFYEQKLVEANLNAEAEKMIMQNKQDEIVALLNSYGEQYKAAGQTLGEKLAQGFQPAIDNIKGMIASITAEISQQRANAISVMMMMNSSSAAAMNSTRVGGPSFGGGSSGSSTKNEYNVAISSPVAQTPSQQRREMESTLRKLAF